MRGALLGLALVGLALTVVCSRAPVPFDADAIEEAYVPSTAALMWPGASRGFQITPEGDLYNGEWRLRVRASAGAESASAPRAIAFEQRWMPIAGWTRRSGPIGWQFEALALPEEAPRDSGLLLSLVCRARNLGSAPAEARLSLDLEPPPGDPVFVAWDAPEDPSPPLAWGRSGAETVHAWSETAGGGASLRPSWTLAPGQSGEVRIVVPTYPTEAARLERSGRRAHQDWAAEVRRRWNRELGRGTAFELGDPEVENALRAARVLLLSCRERRGDRWIPIGGPFHYRDVWLRDGARLIYALAVAGHVPEARALAISFLEFQWPNGVFLSQRGQLDGTGQALWALEQALLRPAPAGDLERVASAARRAVSWMEGQRDAGRASGLRFGAMMTYSEPHDAELAHGRAQLVGTDLWCLRGYQAAAALMRAAGRAGEADSVDAARTRYRAEFLAALERTGRPDVPPAWQPVGRDWGNLTAVWPCAVLPPDDPRYAALAARLWEKSGGAGLVRFGDQAEMQHYYLGADLAMWALLTGRRGAADSVLAAMLAWRSASGAGAEMFGLDGAYGRNPPPHPTSAAALVTLVRNALIFDDGDTLRLTLGARERWWRKSRVRRAPTRWGLLDLALQAEGSTAEWRWTKVPAWTALTLPPGFRLSGEPEPPLRRGRTPAEVLAPPGTGSARVRIEPT